MTSRGIISEDRLAFIETKYHAAHEFCFFLHDHIVSALVEYESSDLHNIVPNALHEVLEKSGADHDEVDIFDFLNTPELKKYYFHYIGSHSVLALIAEMTHFIFEALRAIEKGKYAIAFSLLRKPLKEHIFFLAWILADEKDFVARFEDKPYESFNRISKDRRIAILHSAINKVKTSEAFCAETLWEMIYSKNQPNGFEPIWQRATHLVTSKGPLLKTESFSLNFVFSRGSESEYQNIIYNNLPYLLIFITQVSFSCLSRIQSGNHNALDHLILITMGCYESLFLGYKEQSITPSLKKKLKPFLKCVHCKDVLKIKKKNAPSFYLTERVVCSSCGLVSEFPLFWLLSQSNVSIAEASASESSENI